MNIHVYLVFFLITKRSQLIDCEINNMKLHTPHLGRKI